MNRSLAHTMISKQESMVHLAGLDLHLCSETIEIMSISGCYHLTEDGGHVSKSNSVMKWYGSRKHNVQVSFDEYYDSLKNTVKGAKLVIPHYVGGKVCQCILLQGTMQDLFYFSINLGLERLLRKGVIL